LTRKNATHIFLVSLSSENASHSPHLLTQVKYIFNTLLTLGFKNHQDFKISSILELMILVSLTLQIFNQVAGLRIIGSKNKINLSNNNLEFFKLRTTMI